MADGDTWLTVMGPVYKVTEVTRKGKDCRSVSLQACNTPRKRLDETWFGLTVWPDHEATSIEKGDLIVARGIYSKTPSDDGDDFHNLSVKDLWVIGQPVEKEEVETSGSSRRSKPKDDDEDDIPF